MMSFTGSTRAGIDVVAAAAPTVKRVSQELGGKSPNVILEDADLPKAIAGGAAHCFNNSGQSCNAPTRMLVPMARMAEALRSPRRWRTRPRSAIREPGSHLGPVVNRAQWDKIQGLIKKGIDEGAKLVTGGLGLPDGLNKGFYVRPTVFSHVTNDMTDRAGGDLRPGAVDHRLRGRGRGDPDRQRHALWPGRLRVLGRRGARTRAWRGASAPAM